VTNVIQDYLLANFLIFCRIGSCAMFMPALGSARVPMQVRLLIVTGISMAVSPLLASSMTASLRGAAENAILLQIITEIGIGSAIGLMGRSLLLAVQFAGTFIANMIGLAGIPGIPLEDAEGSTPLAGLLSMSATAILLAAGAHIEAIEAIVDSYEPMPLWIGFDIDWQLTSFINVLAGSSVLAARLAAPLAVYSILINVALGLAGRFTPQLQIYFVATGAVLLGGLIFLMVAMPDWLGLFRETYMTWLRKGEI
jgi:flagellar biosynthesis protein FliR